MDKTRQINAEVNKRNVFLNAFNNPVREYGICPILHDLKGVRKNMGMFLRAEGASLAHTGYLGLAPHCSDSQLLEGEFGGIVTNAAWSRNYLQSADDWKDLREELKWVDAAGLKVWLYDERGYPSGSAGGLTLKEYPEGEALGMFAAVSWQPVPGPCFYCCDVPYGEFFRAYAVSTDDDVHISLDDVIDVSDTLDECGTLHFELPEGRWQVVFLVVRKFYDGTHATHCYGEERRYINLMDPNATKAFLKVTHEAYRRELSDMFGNIVTAFFTDEPSLLSTPIGGDAPMKSLPWRRDFPEFFNRRYGYDIGKALLAELFECGPSTAVLRCNFWDMVSCEVAENYFGIIREWCSEQGILSIGHLLGEENVLHHVPLEGSYYASSKYLDVTGVDMLTSDPKNMMMTEKLPIGRLAASVADIYDKPHVMTEASDFSQRQLNMPFPDEWITASMNWHFCQGVNIITSYFFVDRWQTEFTRQMNRYVSRISSVLHQGKRASRVAVLYPEHSLWAEVVPTKKPWWSGQSKTAEALRKTLNDVSWGLIRSQIEFDYIDHEVLSDGETVKGQLNFRSRNYGAVILAGTTTITQVAADRLKEFARSSGQVFAVNCLPTKLSEQGESPELPAGLKKAGIQFVKLDGPDLPPELSEVLPSPVKLTPYNPLVMVHTRESAGNLIAFVANMGDLEVSGRLSLQGVGRVTILDPNTGNSSEVNAISAAGWTTTEISLKAYQAQIVLRQ